MDNKLYTAEEVAAIIGMTLQSTRRIITASGIYKHNTRKKDEHGQTIYEDRKGIKGKKVGRSYLVTAEAIRDYLGGDFEPPTERAEQRIKAQKVRTQLLPEAKKEAERQATEKGITDPEEIEALAEKIVGRMIHEALAKNKSMEAAQDLGSRDFSGVYIAGQQLEDLKKVLNAVRHKNRTASKENLDRARDLLEYLERMGG